MIALLRKQDCFVKGPESTCRSSGKRLWGQHEVLVVSLLLSKLAPGGCVMLPPKNPRLFFLPGGRKKDQGGKTRLVRFLFFLFLGFWFWKL